MIADYEQRGNCATSKEFHKERYLLPYRDPDPREARRRAGSPEFTALAQEISERGGEPLRFPWTSD